MKEHFREQDFRVFSILSGGREALLFARGMVAVVFLAWFTTTHARGQTQPLRLF